MVRLRRRWRSALQAGSLLLLLAFLPTTLYVGHWGDLTDYTFSPTVSERTADNGHASHCHGVSSCSEQPQPVGVRVFPTVVELSQPSLIDRAGEDHVFIYGEFFLTPPTEPPRL